MCNVQTPVSTSNSPSATRSTVASATTSPFPEQSSVGVLGIVSHSYKLLPITLDPPIVGFPQNTTIGMKIQIPKRNFIQYLDYCVTYTMYDYMKNQIQTAKEKFDYKCQDGIADFSTALEATKKHDLINLIIRTVRKNPDTYMPCNLNGYILTENNHGIFLRNQDQENNDNYGFVDTDKIKLFLAVDANIQKLRNKN